MAAVADNLGPDYEKLCGFFFITLVAATLTLGFTVMIYSLCQELPCILC
jgi:hypothetical protein